MVFPKDFPKDSKIRMQNFHIFALSLVMNELLKVRDIQARLGIGRSAVYALIHEPTFPAPIAINSRILRWEATEFTIDYKDPNPKKILPINTDGKYLGGECA